MGNFWLELSRDISCIGHVITVMWHYNLKSAQANPISTILPNSLAQIYSAHK